MTSLKVLTKLNNYKVLTMITHKNFPKNVRIWISLLLQEKLKYVKKCYTISFYRIRFLNFWKEGSDQKEEHHSPHPTSDFLKSGKKGKKTFPHILHLTGLWWNRNVRKILLLRQNTESMNIETQENKLSKCFKISQCLCNITQP